MCVLSIYDIVFFLASIQFARTTIPVFENGRGSQDTRPSAPIRLGSCTGERTLVGLSDFRGEMIFIVRPSRKPDLSSLVASVWWALSLAWRWPPLVVVYCLEQ